MDQSDAEYLARLVHKGFFDEAAARQALANRGENEALPSLLGRLRLLEEKEAWRLWDNRVGEEPVLARYELRERIGSGVTALVFRALDRKSGETLALKVLREEVARIPCKLKRFVEEARLLCSLEHPGLVDGKRVARDSGAYIHAMELVPGCTLEDQLDEGRTFSEDEALGIVHQVVRVLCYLRGQGIVHRDIKPGNIMRRPDGRVQLIDLGFAARIGQVEASEKTLGTVQYIAPEQAMGEGDLDARADIYALGATLYHLATGEPPFQGDDSTEVLLRQVSEELSSQRIKSLELSSELHYFIEKMMAKEKEIRYQDPKDLLRDFEEKLAGRPFLQGPEEPAAAKRRRKYRSRSSARRRRPRRGRR